MSFAQRRMWFLSQWDPSSPAYNIASAVRFSGPLDVEAFGGALSDVIRRHDSLRARFPTQDGAPTQVIEPELTLELPVYGIEGLSEPERDAEVQRRARTEARRPFDVAAGPLLRASLLQLGPEEHVGLFTLHHIVADGWSIGVLIRELAEIYEARVSGRPPRLPDPGIQYSDFAVWQESLLTPARVSTEVAYWREQLGGAPPIVELPTDRPRPPTLSYDGAHLAFEIPSGTGEKLKALAVKERATVFQAFLAAWTVLISRYASQDDICVGIPVANRGRMELEDLIGFFVNTLVVRTDLSGSPTFRDVLRLSRDTTLAAQEHQDLPFEVLVDELRPERSTSRTPLFQVMFSLQNAPAHGLELAGVRLEPLDTESGTAKTDLMLIVEEKGASLRGILEYNTDLFDESTIRRMAEHFEELLRGVVADPSGLPGVGAVAAEGGRAGASSGGVVR